MFKPNRSNRLTDCLNWFNRNRKLQKPLEPNRLRFLWKNYVKSAHLQVHLLSNKTKSHCKWTYWWFCCSIAVQCHRMKKTAQALWFHIIFQIVLLWHYWKWMNLWSEKCSNIASNALRSEIWKVSKAGAGQKFHRFPSETYVVRVKYQKLAKSVQGNLGFWINFSLEKVCLFFEVKSKGNM